MQNFRRNHKSCMRFIVFLTIAISTSLEAMANHEYFFKSHPGKVGEEKVKIETVYSGSNGLIWLGTDRGLYFYDGREYAAVPLADTTGISTISAICENPHGEIWVGTKDGKIYQLEDDVLKEYPTFADSIEVGISAITCTGNNQLWIGTRGKGLFSIADDEVKQYRAPQISDDYINDLFSKDGKLWVGTDRGLTIISVANTDSLNFDFITAGDGLPDNIVWAISSDSASDILWIGFQAGAFCGYDVKSKSLLLPEARAAWNYGAINRILVFHDDLIWLGTNGAGVIEWSRKNDPGLYPLDYSEDLSQSRISDMELDAECNAWLATNQSGLLSANRQVSFIGFADDEGSMKNIHAVHADREGNIWYATDDGLYRYTPDMVEANSEKYMDLADGELIISIFSSSPGELWLGTFGSGLYYFNINTNSKFKVTRQEGLINNNILSISGNSKEVWLATLGGVSKCSFESPVLAVGGLTFTNYSQQDGLGTNYVYQAFIDSKDRIWFATDGEGITKLDKGNFTNYNRNDGLESEVIYSITEDGKGNIWFSTPDQGIFKITDTAFVQLNQKDGIRSLNITSLFTDAMGRIVIVHDEGIDILDPDSEHIYAAGENEMLSNLQSDLNDHTIDNNGVAWIGSNNGLVRYEALPVSCRKQPKTILLNVRIMLEQESFKDAKVLPYSKNHVSFEYAGLWYQNPEKVGYQHMLEGYDLRWIDSRDESVIYPNLNPGTYTFKLRSSIDKNFSDAEVVTFNFRVQPPFYLTPWFIIGVILLITLSVYWYIRARERRLKALERLEKEKIDFQFQTLRSQVNPHFLFNSFNTLLNIIDLDREKASDYVERLSDFFRNLLTYREKEVITLEEELKILDDYYYLQQKRYGENFKLEINTPEAELFCIPPMTLQLLVENALKHNVVSRKKPLTVNIYYDGDNLLVINDLQRKIKSEQSTKVGLRNVIKRYELLSEKPVEVSETSKKFIVKLPLIKCEP